MYMLFIDDEAGNGLTYSATLDAGVGVSDIMRIGARVEGETITPFVSEPYGFTSRNDLTPITLASLVSSFTGVNGAPEWSSSTGRTYYGLGGYSGNYVGTLTQELEYDTIEIDTLTGPGCDDPPTQVLMESDGDVSTLPIFTFDPAWPAK
jgi:hypothetical protein